MEFGRQTGEDLPHPATTLAAERAEWSLGFLAGRSPIMQRLFSQMRATAPHLRIATIEGESGAGKTSAARTLHALGPASSGIFFPCPAAQFFDRMTPVIRESRDGTLLLSHIEDLAADQQLRLLDFLQWLDQQHARRATDSAPRQVFFSSNQPVRKLVSALSLRIDLANRLTVIRFTVPPLRERREDIPLLAEQFMEHFSAARNRLLRGLAPQALQLLMNHNWPGNLREFESCMHAAALRCEDHENQWIRPIDIPAFSPAGAPPQFPQPSNDRSTPCRNAQAGGENHRSPLANHDPNYVTNLNPNLDPNLDRAIHLHITRVLASVDGNKLRAARLLGISRSTLYRLLESGGARQ